jgi:hypothetical protein
MLKWDHPRTFAMSLDSLSAVAQLAILRGLAGVVVPSGGFGCLGA